MPEETWFILRTCGWIKKQKYLAHEANKDKTGKILGKMFQCKNLGSIKAQINGIKSQEIHIAIGMYELRFMRSQIH